MFPTTRGRWRCVLSTSVISVPPPAGHTMSKWSNSYFIFYKYFICKHLERPSSTTSIIKSHRNLLSVHAGIAALVCRTYIVVLSPAVHVTYRISSDFGDLFSFLLPCELPASFCSWRWFLQTFSELNILGFFFYWWFADMWIRNHFIPLINSYTL